jgi:hypothetical protein
MRVSIKITLFTVLFTLIFLIGMVYAIPSGGDYPPQFIYKNGSWYDSWDYNRNYFAGEDGYLPNVAYESIGSNKELAYEIGHLFEENYDSKVERAEAILNYVQQWTDYGYDEDNVFKNGVAQAEWAWNADEMAHMFNETTNLVAIGDCEDMSFLCATLYQASKFDVALVDAPEHVALLIWLPEYDNANYYWDILGDGRGYGWIWVEATGEVNPLGWTPPDFSDGNWNSYVLGYSKFNIVYSPKNPKAEDDVTVKAIIESKMSSIKTVSLTYFVGFNSQEISMINKGSFYEAVIPKQSNGVKVTCRIKVTNDEEFTSEQEFEYTVGDEFNFPPFLFEAVIILMAIFLIISVLSRFS